MASQGATRFGGLDPLRFIAIVLVTAQHALSVTGRYSQTDFAGISLGQTGVALFCAISGFLAFGRPGEATGKWLLTRLGNLFPAYWLAMLFSFAVTWVFHAKAFTAWQFVSQMLGTGYFTHGWDLVNVVSWFLSLILLCYGIAAVARWSGRPFLLLAAVAVLAAGLVATKAEVNLSRHVIAFALGAMLRLLALRRRTSLFLALPAAATALWWVFGPQFGYAAISGALIYLATASPFPSLPWLARISGYIYEYFLLHGIFLVGMARVLSAHPALAVALAVALSVLAAFLLKLTVDFLGRRFARRAG